MLSNAKVIMVINLYCWVILSTVFHPFWNLTDKFISDVSSINIGKLWAALVKSAQRKKNSKFISLNPTEPHTNTTIIKYLGRYNTPTESQENQLDAQRILRRREELNTRPSACKSDALSIRPRVTRWNVAANTRLSSYVQLVYNDKEERARETGRCIGDTVSQQTRLEEAEI